jgi:hypothetical protein
MPRQPLDIGEFLAENAPAAESPGIPARPAAPAGENTDQPAALTAPSRSDESRRRRQERGPRRARLSGAAGVTESQTPGESQGPKWQRLERKELRLRADQLDELARIRRTLNRQRRGEGERITENTLIRVAVDMLLGRADRLRGSTEEELRKSVTS